MTHKNIIVRWFCTPNKMWTKKPTSMCGESNETPYNMLQQNDYTKILYQKQDINKWTHIVLPKDERPQD